MHALNKSFHLPEDLRLGSIENSRVGIIDQRRQRYEAAEILKRFRRQPGVILADEVGMGKTFVALAVACAVAFQDSADPVVVMVPKNLIDKWCRDLDAFCELYLPNRKAVQGRGNVSKKESTRPNVILYGWANHSVDYLKLLDDPKRMRCQIIFLAHGAMSSGLSRSMSLV